MPENRSDARSAAQGRRFVVITLDVPVGDEFAFGPDDDHGIAETVAGDLREAGYEILGISVYGLGRAADEST